MMGVTGGRVYPPHIPTYSKVSLVKNVVEIQLIPGSRSVIQVVKSLTSGIEEMKQGLIVGTQTQENMY